MSGLRLLATGLQPMPYCAWWCTSEMRHACLKACFRSMHGSWNNEIDDQSHARYVLLFIYKRKHM